MPALLKISMWEFGSPTQNFYTISESNGGDNRKHESYVKNRNFTGQFETSYNKITKEAPELLIIEAWNRLFTSGDTFKLEETKDLSNVTYAASWDSK